METIKIESIKSAIESIRARVENMEWFVDKLRTEELCFFNTDLQHIFDSLLDIDNETHFFDGMYKDYAGYLSEQILLRSRGLRLSAEEETEVFFNRLEHWNE